MPIQILGWIIRHECKLGMYRLYNHIKLPIINNNRTANRSSNCSVTCIMTYFVFYVVLVAYDHVEQYARYKLRLLGWLCGVVLWLFLRETEVKQRWARLVLGWVTVHDRSRFVSQWGVLMQPKNRYRMTPGVRHSGIVNWLLPAMYTAPTGIKYVHVSLNGVYSYRFVRCYSR